MNIDFTNFLDSQRRCGGYSERSATVPANLGPPTGVGVFQLSLSVQHAKSSSFDSLPGAPVTNITTIVELLKHGVTVGLGVWDPGDAGNLYQAVAWVINSNWIPKRNITEEINA